VADRRRWALSPSTVPLSVRLRELGAAAGAEDAEPPVP